MKMAQIVIAKTKMISLAKVIALTKVTTFVTTFVMVVALINLSSHPRSALFAHAGAGQHIHHMEHLHLAQSTQQPTLTQSPPPGLIQEQDLYDYTFAVVKYNGGGDWYEGRVGVKELMKFINQHDLFNVAPQSKVVEISSFDLFEYPLLYLTGHGGFVLSASEANRLREYLENGGLLFINDDYGLDSFVQTAVAKIFPERKWVELSFDHPIFSIYYPFPQGAPKIHKHDGGPPEVYAIFQDGEIAILYIKNTDIGDGWAPYQVHKDSPAVRRSALRFGMNIILYALTK